jgi:hypothetical protein
LRTKGADVAADVVVAGCGCRCRSRRSWNFGTFLIDLTE